MPACRFSFVIHTCPLCCRVAVACSAAPATASVLQVVMRCSFSSAFASKEFRPRARDPESNGDATWVTTSHLLCRVAQDPETPSLSQSGQDTSNLGGVVMVAEHSVWALEEDNRQILVGAWRHGGLGMPAVEAWSRPMKGARLTRHTIDISSVADRCRLSILGLAQGLLVKCYHTSPKSLHECPPPNPESES